MCLSSEECVCVLCANRCAVLHTVSEGGRLHIGGSFDVTFFAFIHSLFLAHRRHGTSHRLCETLIGSYLLKCLAAHTVSLIMSHSYDSEPMY